MLWAGRTVILIPGEAKNFSLRKNLQTGSGVHPVSMQGSPACFPSVMLWGRDVNDSSPSSVEVKI